jgi:hypothetical protein
MTGLSRSFGRPARRETTFPLGWTRRAAAALILVIGAAPAWPATDASPPGASGQPYAASRTYDLTGREPKQAWFICDGTDSGRLFLVGLPNRARRLPILVLDKSRRTASSVDEFDLGPPDPGAGQVYWPLTTRRTRDAGNLHAFNPGALGEPSNATTPTFGSIRLRSLHSSCRWVERTRLMGYSARRSFLITQAANGDLVYSTFDFRDAAKAKTLAPDGAQRTTTPSLTIAGGKETKDGLVFRNDGYVYTVEAAPPGRPPRADVLVSKGGKLISAEALQAYTVAPKP